MNIEELNNERKKRGISVEDLAARAKLPKSTVEKVLFGITKNPRLDTVQAIENALGLPVSTSLPRNVYPVSKMVEIPILGSVRAGVGGHFEEEQLGMQTLPIEFLHDHLPQDVFFLQIKGDSMYPRIEEGCLALVKRQTSVDSGTVAVVSIDNEEAVIKKVYYDKDWIELVSFNPNYPTRRFEGPEVMRVYVVGKVISTMQNW